MSVNGARPESADWARLPELETRRRILLASLRAVVMNDAVIDAIAGVPRELFVPAELREAAYEDRALPIGAGQTISQPLMVATMTSALMPRSTDRVLEVGTGSGYQAAVLSRLAAEIVTVERIRPLANTAARRLAALGYENVVVRLSLNGLGQPEEAPYDGILVAAAAPQVPQALLEQLALGGRLVIPVGPTDQQSLMVCTRRPGGDFMENLGACQFVPLIGPEGWEE